MYCVGYAGATTGIWSVMFWLGCTSNGIGTWIAPGNVLPVALLTHL